MRYQMLYRRIGPSVAVYSQFRQRPRKDGLTRPTGPKSPAQTPANVDRWLMVASPDGFGLANRAALGSNSEAAISENVVQAVVVYISGLVCPRVERRPVFSAKVVAAT